MKWAKMLFAATCLVSAAMAQDVRYNYAAGFDFHSLKTYKWETSRSEERLDQLTDSQIKAAIDSQMSKKGYQLVTRGRADMILKYEPSVQREKQVTLINDGWGFGRGWRGWNTGMGVTTAQTSTIRVGELALDVYDTSSEKLVWRGVATKTLDPHAKPDKWQKTINTGTAKLLKNFPPKA